MARHKSHQQGIVEEFPRGSGRWTVRYREYDFALRQWKSRRETLGAFKSKREARRAAEPIMARVNQHNNGDGKAPLPIKPLTFSDFIAGRWRAYEASAKHQPSTRDNSDSLIRRHIEPALGDKVLARISPGDISDLLQSKSSMSPNTQSRLYGMLHLMFDIAVQFDLISVSPIRPKLHKPESARGSKPTLTAEQIRSILDHLKPQERLFILLLAVTGLRSGEVLALRWTDFDVDRLDLEINHTLYRGKLKSPKTESSARRIALVPAIAALLSDHRRTSRFSKATDFIFCRADGRPLSPQVTRRHLYKAMDAAEVFRSARQYGFHIFRHTAGSLLYSKSRDLKLVQDALGHSKIGTTSDIYVHLQDADRSHATVLLFDEICGNSDQIATCRRKRKAG